ncbi:MAG TPA: hypothetical protein VFW73_08330 [Lacipirellulaceae bacterium]|nr:hypothetical protein [Lacipirellulaceae bacterium]
MATITTRAPSYLAPERLYSLRGFQAAAGVSATRMRYARASGIALPTIDVGRRKFIRGADAIAYIERLAELDAGTAT